MTKTKSGFTIVELLIVIVVIGILAVITVVAYNGIQDRAKFTRQASELEQVVRAIQLYKADGGSMADGVAGAGGNGSWYGGVDTIYSGSQKTIRQALIDSGHLSPTFNASFMVSLCSSGTDTRRIVLGRFTPIPLATPQEQIGSNTCNASTFTTYTDPAQQYKMNYAKVVN